MPTTAVQCSSLGDVWITIAAIPTGMIVFEMLSGKVFQSTFLVVNKLVTSWIAVLTTTDMVAMWVNGHSGNDFPYGLLVTSTITTNTTSANTVKVATVAETNLARAICCPRIILPKRYLLQGNRVLKQSFRNMLTCHDPVNHVEVAGHGKIPESNYSRPFRRLGRSPCGTHLTPQTGGHHRNRHLRQHLRR